MVNTIVVEEAPTREKCLVNASVGHFLNSLSSVVGLADSRALVVVNRNVLLEKEGNSLKLTCSNESATIQRTDQLGGSDLQARVTADPRKLIGLLRLLDSQSLVSVSLDNGRLKLKCGRSSYNLSTLAADAYPSFNMEDMERAPIAMRQDVLRSMLMQVRNCMCEGDLKPYLNGALLDIDGSTLSVVGTNGASMAVTQKQIDSAGEKFSEVIPRKIVIELLRLLGESDKTVEIKFGKNQVSFKFEGVELVSRTIGGFPNWQRVIAVNKPFAHEVEVDREELVSALQVCSKVIESNGRREVRVKIDASGLVFSTKKEDDDCEIGVEASVSGDPVDFGWNVGFALDGLTPFTGDKMNISFNNYNAAIHFKSLGNDGALFILMPLRV